MSSQGPLAGCRVVEMSVHRAGPFCGALLADLGADVIKLERPGTGDPARDQGPGPDGLSGYFMANNRNKRSVTVDLKSEAGVEAALALLEDADVFVENFAYEVPERLGIGYEAVRERNPEIVYASVKGYGETGPSREKKGLDLILQAEGGIMSITGPEGGSPVKVGQAIGDLTAGMQAAIGVLAKLYERGSLGGDETASGGEPFSGKLDVGLFDAIVSLMNEYLTFHSLTGAVPGPQGVTHQSIVPYQLFETADGHLVTGVPSDDRWPAFCEAIDRADLEEYETNAARAAAGERLLDEIEAEFETEPTAYWLDRLTEYGLPNGPLNDVADVLDHEQTAARDLVWSAENSEGSASEPSGENVLIPGHPIHFPEYDPELRRPAPGLGVHTAEVFGALTEQTTLDRWREEGAFGGD